MAERVRWLSKEEILSNIPRPFGGQSDNFLAVVGGACAQHQSVLQQLLSRTTNRVLWQKVRSREFWPTCRAHWTSEDLIANVRFEKDTFWLVVDRLRPYIQRETTRLRRSIDVDERVAMALWRFGSGNSPRTIAWMFGVVESTKDLC